VSRILCLNYEYPPLGGGAGNATANIAREMTRQGAEVLVVTSAFKGLPALERTDGFSIRRIPTIRRREEKCAAWEMAVFMASACLSLPSAVRRFKPDAILAFFGIPCGPPSWLVKAFSGTPYVVSLRGGDVPGFQPYDLARMHALTGPLIRFLWCRAGAVVPNSAGLAALARAFEPRLDYPVIPNGVDSELYRPHRTVRRAGPVRLFFHGRVVYQKGLDVLLDALGHLPHVPDVPGAAHEPAWELHVAGDGPQRAQLEAQARALHIADRIFFRGWMRRPELAEIMRDMDAYVFASRDEGMPNAVLEAMASGLPVVATRIAGSEELVVPETTGLLVAPGSSEELTRALARIIGGPERTRGQTEDWRRSLGLAGRERVEKEYSWASVAASYLALCEGLTRNR
jgi:glycosyltransferase involved in cell wall biosynthesis